MMQILGKNCKQAYFDHQKNCALRSPIHRLKYMRTQLIVKYEKIPYLKNMQGKI